MGKTFEGFQKGNLVQLKPWEEADDVEIAHGVPYRIVNLYKIDGVAYIDIRNDEMLPSDEYFHKQQLVEEFERYKKE